MFVLRTNLSAIVPTITHYRLPDRYARLVPHDEFHVSERSTSFLALSNPSHEFENSLFGLDPESCGGLCPAMLHPCIALNNLPCTSQLPPSSRRSHIITR
jgi:hypothetical protein